MKYFPLKEDIQKLDMLPHWQNRYQYQVDTFGGYQRSSYRIGHYNPYKIKDRILKNNIGKSFDMAFHYFCTKVKKKDQSLFLEEFREKRRFHWRWNPYYTDENGLIQRVPSSKPKKEVTFKSDDYKVEKRHKVTGQKKITDWYLLRRISPWKIPHESEYHNVVVSGWIKTFSSRNDPQYRRLYTEKLKAKRKFDRDHPKRKLSDEEFRLILNRDKLDDEEVNRIKIFKKGFDPVTSFRS